MIQSYILKKHTGKKLFRYRGEVRKVEEKKENTFAQERELLHKQLELLAKQSKNVNLEAMELAALSEQMAAIYSVLQV